MFIRPDVYFALRGWPWGNPARSPLQFNLAATVGSKPVHIMHTSPRWSLL